MRALKLIVAGLFAALAAAVAITAGFVAAAVVGLTGLAAYGLRKLMGWRTAAPRTPVRPRTSRPAAADVIEVTATEVPSGSLPESPAVHRDV